MAAGDAYQKHPETVTNGSHLDLQPSAGVEVVIHNAYVPEGTAVEYYYFDGTDTIKFDSGTDGTRYGMQWHCTNGTYVRIKNVSGASAILAADGMTTK